MRRVLTRLNYGKWFLKPTQQERVLCQAFIDQGLPEGDPSMPIDWS